MLIAFLNDSPAQTADGYFYGKEVADLSRSTAVFVRVAYTTNRDKAPGDAAFVPTSKLLGDNPSRDYKVTSYPTFIVADSNGNETLRLTKVPSAKDLTAAFGRVTATMTAEAKKLQRNLDAARKAWESKDYSKALRALEKNFKVGLVGLPEQDEGARLYGEIADNARAEVADLSGNKDGTKRLNEIRGAFRNVDKSLVEEIDLAIKAAK